MSYKVLLGLGDSTLISAQDMRVGDIGRIVGCGTYDDCIIIRGGGDKHAMIWFALDRPGSHWTAEEKDRGPSFSVRLLTPSMRLTLEVQ